MEKEKSVQEQLDELFKSIDDKELAKLAVSTKKYKYGEKVDEDSKFGDVCSILSYIPKGTQRNSTAIELINLEIINRFITQNS